MTGPLSLSVFPRMGFSTGVLSSSPKREGLARMWMEFGHEKVFPWVHASSLMARMELGEGRESGWAVRSPDRFLLPFQAGADSKFENFEIIYIVSSCLSLNNVTLNTFADI